MPCCFWLIAPGWRLRPARWQRRRSSGIGRLGFRNAANEENRKRPRWDVSLTSEPTEHVIDPVAPFVALLAGLHRFLVVFSTADAAAYPLVFQHVHELVRVMAVAASLQWRRPIFEAQTGRSAVCVQ